MQAVVFLPLCFLLAHADLNLSTIPSVNKTCGATVSLPCSINQNVSVIKYSWSKQNENLCMYNKNQITTESPDGHCKYTDSQEFVLTLRDVQPSDSQTYFCKVITETGHKRSNTVLHVSDCSFVNERYVHPGLLNEPPPNQACATGSEEIYFLISLTATLLLVLDFKI